MATFVEHRKEAIERAVDATRILARQEELSFRDHERAGKGWAEGVEDREADMDRKGFNRVPVSCVP